MTVMLDLPPELEKRLREEAAEQGQDARMLLQQMVYQMLTPSPGTSIQPRIAGLNRGQIWIADDFDAPLPDEFWMGET